MPSEISTRHARRVEDRPPSRVEIRPSNPIGRERARPRSCSTRPGRCGRPTVSSSAIWHHRRSCPTTSRSTTRCSTPRVMVGAIPPSLWLERRRRAARHLFRHGARQPGRRGGRLRPHPSTATSITASPRLEMTQVVRHQLSLYGAGAFGRAGLSSPTKPVEEFLEAKALGVHTRPVLVGPLTFLKLGNYRSPLRIR